MTVKNLELRYGKTDSGEWEVVNEHFSSDRSRDRRICLCTHEQDAEDIVKALYYAHSVGIV